MKVNRVRDVLIYKRTHPRDPDVDGRFGCEDCMGAVRSRSYDAVIGVGGIRKQCVPDLNYWTFDN
jgi:hypothetical protein